MFLTLQSSCSQLRRLSHRLPQWLLDERALWAWLFPAASLNRVEESITSFSDAAHAERINSASNVASSSSPHAPNRWSSSWGFRRSSEQKQLISKRTALSCTKPTVEFFDTHQTYPQSLAVPLRLAAVHRSRNDLSFTPFGSSWRTFSASAHSHSTEDTSEQPQELILPVQAIHIGSKINLEQLNSELGYMQHESGRDHCIFWRTEIADDTKILDVSRDKVELPRYAVVVWRFGSVVFFNPDPDSMETWVDLISKHTQNLLKDPLEEGVTLVIRPSLDSWYIQEPDRMVVQVLDVGNTRIISRILAQSVALDFHTRKVDSALQSINDILTALAVKGRSHKMTNQTELFKFIAENNLLYTEVISKLGLLDMSETAWDTERYFELWSSLHQDFEIDKRFRALQAKLLPIQENAKFLLQVRHDQKSERQELIIIWLIAIEIALMCTQVFLEFGL